jgi:hypothetical protein
LFEAILECLVSCCVAGNNGKMPGPDGGSVTNYLALDGGYGFGRYGGGGTWGATHR